MHSKTKETSLHSFQIRFTCIRQVRRVLKTSPTMLSLSSLMIYCWQSFAESTTFISTSSNYHVNKFAMTGAGMLIAPTPIAPNSTSVSFPSALITEPSVRPTTHPRPTLPGLTTLATHLNSRQCPIETIVHPHPPVQPHPFSFQPCLS